MESNPGESVRQGQEVVIVDADGIMHSGRVFRVMGENDDAMVGVTMESPYAGGREEKTTVRGSAVVGVLPEDTESHEVQTEAAPPADDEKLRVPGHMGRRIKRRERVAEGLRGLLGRRRNKYEAFTVPGFEAEALPEEEQPQAEPIPEAKETKANTQFWQETERRPARRRRLAVAAGALVVAGALAFAAWKWTDNDTVPTEGDFDRSGELSTTTTTLPETTETTVMPPETTTTTEAPTTTTTAPAREFEVDESGETAWGVLQEAGYPPHEIESTLDAAARRLQAERGIPFEWHGSGMNRWLEVGGSSDQAVVIRALSPYIPSR
jgi:hypothetical protein